MERLPNSTNALARKRHATRLHKTAPRTPLQLHLGDASVQVNAHASQRANKQAKKEAKKVAANNKTNPQAESKDEKKANVGEDQGRFDAASSARARRREPTKQADHVDGHSENRKPAKQAATGDREGQRKVVKQANDSKEEPRSNQPRSPEKSTKAARHESTQSGRLPGFSPPPTRSCKRRPKRHRSGASTMVVGTASHWKRKSPSANEKAQEKAKATTNTAATTNGTEVQESRLFPLKNHFAALANLEADASVEQTNLHDKQESKSKDREDEDTRTTAANASTPTLSSRRTNMAATRSTGESTSSRRSRRRISRATYAQGNSSGNTEA